MTTLSSHLDHRVKDFLNTLNGSGSTPMQQLSPQEARQVLTDAQHSVEVDLSGITTTEKTLTIEGRDVTLYIVKPEKAEASLPAFMFCHGGGWILGDFPTHKRLVRDLVVASGAAAVFVEYTRSPEARYPTALNEAYAATEWVVNHGHEVGLDGQRVAVAGNSAGGNMAAGISLMAKERKAFTLKAQLMLWPVTQARFDTASYQEFSEGYFLSTAMMEWFWDNYAPNAAQRRDILASPLNATTEQLQGLPPALVQVAELDVLRDEGEAFARKLDAAGVDVSAVRCNGLIHDYGLLNALHQVPGVQVALYQAAAFLKHHLFA